MGLPNFVRQSPAYPFVPLEIQWHLNLVAPKSTPKIRNVKIRLTIVFNYRGNANSLICIRMTATDCS